MAIPSLFSVASKILSTIDSPTFRKAYVAKFGPQPELFRFKYAMDTIKCVLQDAESQQEDSDSVKNWVERVKDAFDDTEELFGKILSTDPINNQKMTVNRLFETVKVFLFGSNSNTTLFAQFGDVMRRLIQISEDMKPFKFMRCKNHRSSRSGAFFLDPKGVVGRLGDKKSIMESIFDESDASQGVPVTAIVGAMGIGKTMLARMVYNDESVRNRFEKRWWVGDSVSIDRKQLIENIFRVMTSSWDLDLQTEDEIVSGIKQSVRGSQSFLIVLDGVVDEGYDKWRYVLSLLRSNAAVGSKIIVTTRYPSIARAMGAVRIHRVKRLSDDETWQMFESLAFDEEKKNDPYWRNLGKVVVKKCPNVPLAIEIKAYLLFPRSTSGEWKFYMNSVISLN